MDRRDSSPRNERKTLLIALPYGIGWQTIINQKSLGYLAERGLQTLLLVETQDLVPSGKGIIVRPLIRYNRSRWEIALGILRNFVFLDTNRPFSETFGLNVRKEEMRNSRIGLIRRLFGKRMSKSKIVKRVLSWADANLFSDRFYGQLFEEARPDAVFTIYPFFYHVYPVLRRASKGKVPTIAYIPSWDNLTSKSEIPIKIDRLIVWNEIMKREAMALLDYDPEDVKVSGVPQFDLYGEDSTIMAREVFVKTLGGDQEKRILTYATGSTQLSTEVELDIVDIIYSAIKSGEFRKPCQLILRLHPRRRLEDFIKFRGKEDLIVQTPGKLSQELAASGYFWYSDLSDHELLANTMAHSDVLINIASTVSIEACIFDTPVVNVGFDGKKEKPYLESVRRFYEYAHYKNVVREGGVRVAWNRDDLVNYINAYLDNPRKDSEGRKRIVEQQCYKVDGRSLERMLDYVVEFVREKRS